MIIFVFYTSVDLSLGLIGIFCFVNFQVPVAPLQRPDGPPFLNQMWRNESPRVVDHPPEQGIPTVISWNYGGNEVFLEGSWDNWMSR